MSKKKADQETVEAVQNPPEHLKEKQTKKSSKKSSKTNKLQEAHDKLQVDLQEMKDKYLRLYAEFENYKKRNIKERLDLIKSASQETIASLLPVLDDFDRAKNSAEDANTDESFSDGVNLVYNKLYATLEKQGLEQMQTNGETFDAELHDAITKIPAPSAEMTGKIIDTIEKGYKLNDKIIRHAKVVVGS